MNALRALLTVFSVDTGQAETKLKQLDGTIDNVKGALKTVAGSLLGAFSIGTVKHFIDEQIDLGSKINDTAEKLGVGTEELQKFQFAAGLAGVESEQAAQALGFLNKNIGEAIDGGKEQAKTFAELGIALKDGHGQVRELGDVIPELATAFEKMDSAQERTTTAMKLFGKSGAALIPLLKEGSGGLAELYQQFDQLGLVIDEDFIKKADEAGDQIDILKSAFRALKTRIAVEVLPGIIELAKKFQGWVGWTIKLTKETNIVKYAWVALGAAASVAAGKAVVGWAKFFGIFNGKQSLIKNVFSLGTFGLVVAAVLLLALIFEDLWIGIKGGQSVIREWLNETLGIEDTNEFFQQLSDTIDTISQTFKEMGPDLKDIAKTLLEVARDAGPLIAKAFIVVVKVIASALTLLTGFAGALEKLVKGDFSGAGKAIDKAGDRVFEKNGIWAREIWGNEALVPNPTPTIRQPTSMQRGDANVDLTQDVNITISGAQNPDATGRGVASALRGAQTDGLRAAAAAAFRGAGDDE